MSEGEVAWAYAWRIITLVIGVLMFFLSSIGIISFIAFIIIVLEAISILEYGKTTDEEREDVSVKGTQLGLLPWYIIIITVIIYIVFTYGSKIKDFAKKTGDYARTIGNPSKVI